MTPPNVEPPPAAVLPLVSPAQTDALKLDLLIATNRMIERLFDKQPNLAPDARRALERNAKRECAEIVKRAAVSCADAINGLDPGVKQSSS